MGIESCAYYNTFYNAEQYFAEAQKLTKDNQLETVSRQELNLYLKAIEKSRKLLKQYPESKYADDAQFMIAKAYYFKGDHLLAKRHFEVLAQNYSSSEYNREVPLWIGRCLMKVGDLEMAKHEASRIINSDASKTQQADALLLMGEVAVKQDSLALAEQYLEQVIDRSPDGFTKAQAQFQVGKMRESQLNYQGALDAYRSVSKFKPSESLKVEAIIRQTSMLKALGKDQDAVVMIQDMLLSEKFVDIRAQLEVELGKLYITLEDYDKAESKLKSVVENYPRKEIAAEADFVLGELFLINKFDYKAAHKAYSDIRVHASRSPFVAQGNHRIKQIDQYQKIQQDYSNLKRQLSGLSPIVKAQSSRTNERGTRGGRSRGRSRGNEPEEGLIEEPAAPLKAKQEQKVETAVEVSTADSLQFIANMDENRYMLAEYMLFEFARVDTALELLRALEQNSTDIGVKQQSAYMQYYALESIRGDSVAGQIAAAHIQSSYPDYYKTVMGDPDQSELASDPDEDRLHQIAVLFDGGDYASVSARYQKLKDDGNISEALRSKACFNYAWLNDHFLYDKDAAIRAYTEMIDKYPENPLTVTARNRLGVLSYEGVSSAPEGNGTEDNDQKD